jgi:uncharacterized cupin superfamily protein
MQSASVIGAFAKFRKISDAQFLSVTKFLQLVCAVTAVIFTIVAVVELQTYLRFKESIPHPGQHTLALEPNPVDPSWIVAGSPVFRSAVYEGSPDWDDWSGVWECVGPAKFVWHYVVDETIYIIEGAAEVEYLGETFELRPGDHARFISGTTANWVVRDRVKKTFAIQNPGRVARAVRRVVRFFEAK